LVLKRDIKQGEIIKAEDLIPKRPGTGISPQFADIVAGRTAKLDIAEDTILTWDMI
ncbi:MAG: acetylneuraminic acid synthetase, partial [Firmicutes bacterium]|nr:acetylneuraminic acid synthetase [Bacillota bacterium]